MDNNVTVRHREFLDPNLHGTSVKQVTSLLSQQQDLPEIAQLLSSLLLRAQVTSPEDAPEFLRSIQIIGAALADPEDRSCPSLGDILRTLAKVSQNAGLKMDSYVIAKSSGTVVSVN